MEFVTAMQRLQAYQAALEPPRSIFLLPEAGMRRLYDRVVQERLQSCLELGSGFGATSCILAAAAAETGGRVTTVDLALHAPANPVVLKTHLGFGDELEIVTDPLGYNWVLADWILSQTVRGTCRPRFDLCFVDGAHEWQPDALAVFLAVKLLKPGGWLVIDDVDFRLRSLPKWQETHAHLSDRELDADQVGMIWRLVVRQHPDLCDFRLTEHGRIGWARKVPQTARRRTLTRRILDRIAGTGPVGR